MKKFLSIFSIALVALFAMGCENNNNEKTGGKSFSFGEATIDASSIEVVVTPSDDATLYCADIVATAELDGKDDATIIREWLTDGKHTARSGMQVIGKSGLKSETSYTLVAFYITETNKATRKVFTTDKAIAALPGDEFNVTIEVTDITATSAVATATPNGINQYFFRIITKMELTAMGVYNNDFEVFKYIVENPNNNNYIVTGPTTLTPMLSPEMEYLAVAFNVENYEAVLNKQEDVKLFRYAFTTPKLEYDEGVLFTYNNIQSSPFGFSIDVIPSRGEESLWTYYVWTKKSYDETLAKESSNAIVMRSYWALYNLAGEAFIWDFGQFIRDYMGQTGSSRIGQYQPLESNSDYVVVLFYVDPNVGTDPTEVYDYKYVAVDVHTTDTTLEPAQMTVSEPVIVKNGMKYDIQFNVKVSEDAQSLKVGAQLWANYEFDKYWNPNDWTSIQAFFKYGSKYLSEESLAEAKSEQGTTFALEGADKDDYVVFFEALNPEYTKTQFGVRITADMFNNAQ